jgi:hypothetical protein
LAKEGTGDILNAFDAFVLVGLRISSFYVTVVSDKPGGFRYSKVSGSVAPIASDNSMVLFEGVGKSYPCRKTFPNRIWNGGIQYVVLDDPLETTTTFIGGRQGAGIMFDVDFNRAPRIISMELHMHSFGRRGIFEDFTKLGTRDLRTFNQLGI